MEDVAREKNSRGYLNPAWIQAGYLNNAHGCRMSKVVDYLVRL